MRFLLILLLMWTSSTLSFALNEGQNFMEKLYETYHGKWYKSFTFRQTTEQYKNGQLLKSETWYEFGQFPDKFKINFGLPSEQNAAIYRMDSLIVFKQGKQVTARPEKNDLLFLLGGMYFYPKKEFLSRLSAFGYDVSKSRTGSLNGDKVFVIGANSEHEKSNQLWFDPNKNILKRILKYEDGNEEDIIFEDHQKVGDAWIEGKITFYRNGQILQIEHYHDFKPNVSLNEKIFYTADYQDTKPENNEVKINIRSLKWLPNSHKFWTRETDGIYITDVSNLQERKRIISTEDLKASGLESMTEDIVWANDLNQILIYTNSSKVWRANTKGDYWYFDLATAKGRLLGKGMPSSSSQFAKFSPDGKQIAFVSGHNLYLESNDGKSKKVLTKDGTERIINGTFDWAYEEELGARDGFSWSPDSKNIAFWRIDATAVKNFTMINNTAEQYPKITLIEYPKAGELPSSVKIGIVNVMSKKTKWMEIPGAANNNYLPRLSWAGASEVMVMQLNRDQNHGKFFLCNVQTGKANLFYEEKIDKGWIAPFNVFAWDDAWWTWIDDGKSFLRTHEKDGWLRISKISRDGKKQEILTQGVYDANMLAYDAQNRNIYFEASPKDAIQRYLYKINLDKTDTIRLTPNAFDGTNNYVFSSDGQFALHTHKNINTENNFRLVSLPQHTKLYPSTPDVFIKPTVNYALEKFIVTTEDGIEVDGIMAKPRDFDPSKKYPVFFFTYGEPASTVANDAPYFNAYGAALVPRGYIGIAMDNRGTPTLRGTAYRMAVYKSLGVVNARDQAMAAKEVLKWPFIDTSRVVVHGWSGGGNMTLNLMFKYPEIYKTGIAVAAISDMHLYDNIYMERFMGTPQENEEAYKNSSPVTFAKNLKGNLLYVHGTGDDNVHYQNAEVLINELVKQGKLFEFMAYPNRSHGIYEGQGTYNHLLRTIIDFIERKSPPGAR